MTDNWTRDAAGEHVRWNQPPYRQPGSGALSLLLPGEKPKALNLNEHLKRILEYYLLVRRDSQKIADEIKSRPTIRRDK
jgi:hypothetical protein